MPRAWRLRARPVSSSRVRASTSGPTATKFVALRSSSTAAARNRPSTSSSICSRSRVSVSLRSSASVSNSVAALARSSSTGGRTRSFSSLSTTVALRRAPVGELVGDLALLAGRETAQAVLDLLDEPLGAELDDVVALGGAVARDEVDDGDVAVLRRAAFDRDELGDGALEQLELRLHRLLRHLDLVLRHLERRPVGRLGLRLHLDGRREDPVLLVGRRQLELVLGHRDRVDARAGGGIPEPAADVAVDRLLVDALASDALHEERHRHLALAEARDADAAREVGGGVLDGVMHVVRRDVDRQLDLVVRELFDLGRHPSGH